MKQTGIIIDTPLSSTAAGGHPLICSYQASRRCYDEFHIADAGRPAELRTVRVDKVEILKRHVEDGIRQDLAALSSKPGPDRRRVCSVLCWETVVEFHT